MQSINYAAETVIYPKTGLQKYFVRAFALKAKEIIPVFIIFKQHLSHDFYTLLLTTLCDKIFDFWKGACHILRRLLKIDGCLCTRGTRSNGDPALKILEF